MDFWTISSARRAMDSWRCSSRAHSILRSTRIFRVASGSRYFPGWCSGGLLTNNTVRTLIETGQVGSLAALYQENALNGGVDFFTQPFALGADLLTNYSSASYNSLQVQVRRRAAGRPRLPGQLHVFQGAERCQRHQPEPHRALSGSRESAIERSRASFDLTHALKGTVTYDLPLGKGHRSTPAGSTESSAAGPSAAFSPGNRARRFRSCPAGAR